ncbi:MAG: transcriptional activator NhaR [Pirellulales bacterium]
MEPLNYYNLYTFWTVAREGSIVAACDKLLLAQPTISGQLRQLEKSIGQKLFEREGRGLTLTETGQYVFRYADEIFALGRELVDGLSGLPSLPTGRPVKLQVGVADALPKAVAFKLLQPVLTIPHVRMICQEGKTEQLLTELSQHRLDVVLSDVPLNPALKVRAFSHLLGESTVSIVAVEPLAVQYAEGFPASLDRAPFLLPTENTALRRSLDQWFDAHGIRPAIRAEFDDSALMKFFGRQGGVVFPVPTTVEDEVCQQFGVRTVGRITTVRERYYAISLDRRLKHPAVLAISERARRTLQAAAPS